MGFFADKISFNLFWMYINGEITHNDRCSDSRGGWWEERVDAIGCCDEELVKVRSFIIKWLLSAYLAILWDGEVASSAADQLVNDVVDRVCVFSLLTFKSWKVIKMHYCALNIFVKVHTFINILMISSIGRKMGHGVKLKRRTVTNYSMIYNATHLNSSDQMTGLIFWNVGLVEWLYKDGDVVLFVLNVDGDSGCATAAVNCSITGNDKNVMHLLNLVVQSLGSSYLPWLGVNRKSENNQVKVIISSFTLGGGRVA